MSHKAGKDFFKAKRDWSRRKDLVLGYYLRPYLPKIATQGRPVLVVDGFAGPGKFDDGEPGSPVIICQLLKQATETIRGTTFRAMLVERDPDLAGVLRESIREFASFAEVVQRPFEDALPDIEQLCATHNVFLYLDPFTVSGLSWSALDQVFAHVGRTKSVEVLLNFNVHALGRAACVALGKSFAAESGDDDQLVGESASTKQSLDDVLGGGWWQDQFASARNFPTACFVILDGYLRQLRGRFSEVCWHEIKERHVHAVAKYALVFGSRHPDALVLMNDAMSKSLQFQAEKEKAEGFLIEMRPESLVPDTESLSPVILELCEHWIPRGLAIEKVIRREFGRYLRADIRGQIERLLKSGRLVSKTGSLRINDRIEIRRQST